jgi:cytochrome c oxidase accessory protein FixG
MAYFIGTHALAEMMSHPPLQHPTAFLVMLSVTGGILFDFGWFREQFCTVVCPYGRFQSVLMDEQSTVVTYNQQRGEPRRGSTTATSVSASTAIGDCVNCYRCVQVCPTGIDIRRGVQLECIACTACIDACDDVMKRLKKPLGLIHYGNQSTGSVVPWFKRSRAWVYLGLLIACMSGLAFTVSHRTPIEMTWIRAVGEPYQEIPTTQGHTQVLNHFKVDLRNQTFEEQEIYFSIHSLLLQSNVHLVISNHKNTLNPGEPERADLFIQFPKNILTLGKGTLSIQVTAKSHQIPSKSIIFNQEVHLVGPIH